MNTETIRVFEKLMVKNAARLKLPLFWSEAPCRVVDLCLLRTSLTDCFREDGCLRCSEGGRWWGPSKHKKASLFFVYSFPALIQGLN